VSELFFELRAGPKEDFTFRSYQLSSGDVKEIVSGIVLRRLSCGFLFRFQSNPQYCN
jgi:hypothetical protein